MPEEPSLLSSIPQSVMDYSRKQPLKILYYVSIFLGFVIRLVVSLQAYGMKHPDEIYQSLEMAHYLVYDSGYVPPEFQSSNESIPSYAAARSWLFPMFFAAFMYLGEFIGLDYLNQTLPMIKFYMAIHATLLIPAVYKLSNQITKDELTATLAAFFVAFWFRIIEYTVRTFTNTFFLPLVFYGIYRVLYIQDHPDEGGVAEYFEIGFLLGISTYIRIDMGIFIFGFFVVYFQKEHIIRYLQIGISSLIFWIWGAWIDYSLYSGAKYFSVIINWFTFNIIEGHSTIFGVSGPLFYLGSLIIADLLIFWVLIMIGWPLFLRRNLGKFTIATDEMTGTYLRLLLVNAITWVIFSNMWPVFSFQNGFSIGFPKTHKEPRFVIGAVVLLLIAIASFCRILLRDLPHYRLYRKGQKVIETKSKQFKRYRNIVLVLILTTFLLTSIGATILRDPTDHWEGINRSLMYVGNHADPDHIYIAEVWYVTGYYTYSHVPESTEFHFHPLHTGGDGQSYHITQMNETIFAQLNNTYLILPWYASHGIPNIWQYLEDNNWVQVYEKDDNFTYTQQNTTKSFE